MSSVFKIGRSTPPVDLPVTGNFRFLLFKLIVADQLADLPTPLVMASSGKEWQFYISTIRVHISSHSDNFFEYYDTEFYMV